MVVYLAGAGFGKALTFKEPVQVGGPVDKLNFYFWMGVPTFYGQPRMG